MAQTQVVTVVARQLSGMGVWVQNDLGPPLVAIVEVDEVAETAAGKSLESVSKPLQTAD